MPFTNELLHESITRIDKENKHMPLTFKTTTSSGSFQGLAAGAYMAVCDIVADVGLQPGSGLYPEPKFQLYIRWQVPAERVEFEKDGKKQSGPAVIGKFYTASMNERANLRQMLQSWSGKTFSDDEAEKFDVSRILGKACMLTVTETVKGDKKYSNITGVSPLPKSISRVVPEGDTILYSEDNPKGYASLPEWLRKKIDSQLTSKATGFAPEPDHGADEGSFDDGGLNISDDDIPF